jgi:lipopolysaccharide assembly protein A
MPPFLCYRSGYLLWITPMHYLAWLVRIIVFLVLFGLAIKNNQPVTLRYFFHSEWQTSLVMLLFLFFALGVMIGAFTLMLNVLQMRRELAKAHSQLNRSELPRK